MRSALFSIGVLASKMIGYLDASPYCSWAILERVSPLSTV